ncbi:MAG: right-handed parallel beta-helix repeat-containing protein [Deltaproteobacteria bacterium]|nr:right-handed parallel beta-helix repeat-containing protein [Deltaproteobacteria bacterium]
MPTIVRAEALPLIAPSPLHHPPQRRTATTECPPWARPLLPVLCSSLLLAAGCGVDGRPGLPDGEDRDGATTTGAESAGEDAAATTEAQETCGDDPHTTMETTDGPAPDVGVPVGGNTYYLAVDGDDADPGTEAAPFGSFGHAIDTAAPGDTILVRGGVYLLDTSIEIDKSGTPGAPINLWAHAGETPVLDFSNNPRHANPPQPRDDDSIAATHDAVGIVVGGGSDWWHIRGLTVQGAPYYGVRVYGSNNVFERLVLHDNQASGLELTGKEGFSPSDNLVLHCDSFHNFDPQSNGEDADGFGAKFDLLGPGNVFRGNRAWSNADDGYDFWHAPAVLLEDCWSFDNGFNRPEWVQQLSGGWQGDGLGFKLGQDAGELVLHRVVAWGNKAFGIDENSNGSPGGVTIHNATLVNNAKNGNPIQLDLDDGQPHTVRNTIAFDIDGPGVTDLHPAVDNASNSWNGLGVTAADFVDLDMPTLMLVGSGPRKPDGSLPDLGLRLAPGSSLIDAGVDVGLPFSGAAPDLGAFETTQ